VTDASAFDRLTAGRSDLPVRAAARRPPGGPADRRRAETSFWRFRAPDSVFTTRIALGTTPRIEPPRARFADRSYYVGLESVWDVSPDGRRFVFVGVEDGGNTRLFLMTNWVSAYLSAALTPA
jgi:hypothetical protein